MKTATSCRRCRLEAGTRRVKLPRSDRASLNPARTPPVDQSSAPFSSTGATAKSRCRRRPLPPAPSSFPPPPFLRRREEDRLIRASVASEAERRATATRTSSFNLRARTPILRILPRPTFMVPTLPLSASVEAPSPALSSSPTPPRTLPTTSAAFRLGLLSPSPHLPRSSPTPSPPPVVEGVSTTSTTAAPPLAFAKANSQIKAGSSAASKSSGRSTATTSLQSLTQTTRTRARGRAGGERWLDSEGYEVGGRRKEDGAAGTDTAAPRTLHPPPSKLPAARRASPSSASLVQGRHRPQRRLPVELSAHPPLLLPPLLPKRPTSPLPILRRLPLHPPTPSTTLSYLLPPPSPLPLLPDLPFHREREHRPPHPLLRLRMSLSKRPADRGRCEGKRAELHGRKGRSSGGKLRRRSFFFWCKQTLSSFLPCACTFSDGLGYS
jgi:hypothetical protein